MQENFLQKSKHNEKDNKDIQLLINSSFKWHQILVGLSMSILSSWEYELIILQTMY